MVAALLPYPRSPLPGLPRPLTPTMNDKAQWYVLVGGAFTAIVGLVGVIWAQVFQLRGKRDEIAAKAHDTELGELAKLREELWAETRSLRTRVITVEEKLAEANTAILRQNGMISHIGLRLEALVVLQDLESVRAETRVLIADIQRFTESMPIGIFERQNLIGDKKETEQ